MPTTAPTLASPRPVDAARPPGRLRRLLDLTLVRLVLALFATALAGGLVAQWASDLTRGSAWHHGWPSLAGAAAALLAYALYVRGVERRLPTELSGRRCLPELLAGLAGSASLVALIIGALALTGFYQVRQLDLAVTGLAVAFAQMVFVGVFEELLVRAVLMRLIERPLGSWPALAISSVLFGLAHLPGQGSGVLPVVVAGVGGALFGAAFLSTRRLWLGIGLHTGWNFTLGHVFSIAVSGHDPEAGLITGTLSGPDWLTGGTYGLEGSALTLVALLAATVALLRRAAARGHVRAGRGRQALAGQAPE